MNELVLNADTIDLGDAKVVPRRFCGVWHEPPPTPPVMLPEVKGIGYVVDD